jgi:glycosyltransferase involved in cell wall biosynthesis
MRVLQVISDRERRGAQVFAVGLAEVLRARGHDVSCVALVTGARPALEGVAVLGSSPRGPATLRALRRRMQDADITVSNASTTLAACALASLGARAPFVYRQIGDPRVWSASWPRRARVAAYLRRAAAVVALGPDARRALQRHLFVPAERVTEIPNAVQAADFPLAGDGDRHAARDALGLPDDDGVPVVAYVGALVEEKRVATAVRAVAGTGARLLVAGVGPEETSLRAEAGRCGLDARFVGQLPEVRWAYAAADVVVLPSRTESMPAALIEAGLCGRPVVATAVGDVPFVVERDVTGLLVPPGDEGALGAALGELLADPSRRAAMGAAARERCVRLFDLDAVAPAWEAVLTRAAARPLRTTVPS